MDKSKFHMPTAYTILFLLIILVAVATWLIPAGAYDYVDGVPVAGTYHAVEPNPQGVGDVLKAAFSGFYDAVDVCLFILMVGGFLGVVMKTGAVDAGVANVIRAAGRPGEVADPHSDAAVRPGRHHLRHVGGDHGLLSPADPGVPGGRAMTRWWASA